MADEILIYIFSYLSCIELAKASAVSKRWKKLADVVRKTRRKKIAMSSHSICANQVWSVDLLRKKLLDETGRLMSRPCFVVHLMTNKFLSTIKHKAHNVTTEQGGMDAVDFGSFVNFQGPRQLIDEIGAPFRIISPLSLFISTNGIATAQASANATRCFRFNEPGYGSLSLPSMPEVYRVSVTQLEQATHLPVFGDRAAMSDYFDIDAKSEAIRFMLVLIREKAYVDAFDRQEREDQFLHSIDRLRNADRLRERRSRVEHDGASSFAVSVCYIMTGSVSLLSANNARQDSHHTANITIVNLIERNLNMNNKCQSVQVAQLCVPRNEPNCVHNYDERLELLHDTGIFSTASSESASATNNVNLFALAMASEDRVNMNDIKANMERVFGTHVPLVGMTVDRHFGHDFFPSFDNSNKTTASKTTNALDIKKGPIFYQNDLELFNPETCFSGRSSNSLAIVTVVRIVN